MGSKLDNEATIRACKVRSTVDATNEYGLWFRETPSAASKTLALPTKCKDRYVRLLSTLSNVQWGWLLTITPPGGGAPVPDTAPTLLYDQDSAPNTGHAQAGQTLLAGFPEHVVAPSNAIGIVYIAASATGKFEGVITGDPNRAGATQANGT